MKKLLSTVWKAGYPILISVAVNLFCTYAAVIFFAGMFYRNTGMLSVDIAAGIIDENILLLTGVVSLLIIPVYMLLVRKDSRKFDMDVPDVHNSTVTIIISILGSCGLALSLSLILKLLNILTPDITIEQYAAVFDNSAPIVMIIVTLILGPVCEELLYRGLVFKRIDRVYGYVPAALMSSFVYAISTGSIQRALYSFAFGMMLSLAYKKSGKIWIPVVMHMSAATCLFLADFAGEHLLSSSGAGQLLAAIVSIVIGVGVAVSAFVYLTIYKPEEVKRVQEA